MLMLNRSVYSSKRLFCDFYNYRHGAKTKFNPAMTY